MSGINAKLERLISFDQAVTYADYYRNSTRQVAFLAPPLVTAGPTGVVPRRVLGLPPAPVQPELFPSYAVQSASEYTFGELSGNFKYVQ